MKNIYSYDVFDTCLTRACGCPKNVFLILAESVLGRDPLMGAVRRDFASERIKGEQKARECLINDDNEEVSLKEIYDYCDFSFATTMSKSEIMQREMDIERKLLMPVQSILDLINSQRKNNSQILFISDMYLPKTFIASVLVDLGFLKDGDLLFLSSDVRKSKQTGNLYRFIHDKISVSYRNWIHTGDSLLSDYKIPHKLGIYCHHITHKKTIYECVMEDKEKGALNIETQYLSCLSKSIRLSCNDNPKSRFAADFIAPFYVPFVYHLMEDATRRGINSLYFLARDGWILFHIAKQFNTHFPNLKIKYLYVSRKSLYLPGSAKINIESIDRMMPGGLKSSARWSLDDVIEMLQAEDFDTTKYKDLNCDLYYKINAILNDKEFNVFLQKKQDEQRRLIMEYFEQEGLNDGNNAIVDLVGTRYCHKMINNILNYGGNASVFGYYLKVNELREHGCDYSSVYYGEYLRNDGKTYVIKPQLLFEQYFSASDHFRTRCYRKDDNIVIPLFEEEAINRDELCSIAYVNKKVCEDYAKQYDLLFGSSPHLQYCNVAVSVWSFFYNVPDISYLKAFENLHLSWSKIKNNELLYKQSFVKTIFKIQPWYESNLVYNSPFPKFTTWCLRKSYALWYPNARVFFIGRIKRSILRFKNRYK